MAEIEYMDEGFEDFVLEIEASTLELAKVAVKEAAMLMETAIKRKLSGQRSGKWYKVKNKDGREKTHQASSENEPPANMWGTLIKNIAHTNPEVTGDEVSSSVGVDLDKVPYARRLEFGGSSTTKQGGTVYIAPRSYIRTTFAEQEQAIEAKIREVLGV
jgi:hypothetical protein